jgi:hypothetical protein
MPSTFSTNLALELMATGEQAGTWGNITNTNLGTLIEQAISGYVTQAITDGADTTITIPDGSTGVARNMYIECTGTLTANRNLVVPANKKLYFIYNNTSGGYDVTVKVSGQTGIAVPNGEKKILVSDGTDIVEATSYLSSSVSSLSLTTLAATSANITTLTATSANITNLSATSLTLTNALGVAEGGTGVDSTPTNGQLLIGNGTGFALSTLTAGSNITITNNAGSITLASVALPTINVTASTTISATANNHYVLTAASTATLTLPSSPASGDVVWVTVANGLSTNVVARNSENINGIAEDMTIDNAYAGIQLRYADATEGWVFT